MNYSYIEGLCTSADLTKTEPVDYIPLRPDEGRVGVLKELENSIKRVLNQLITSRNEKQKSRSEYRGGFPLLSTPFQDRRPGGRQILMFNLPFVKGPYAKKLAKSLQMNGKKSFICVILQMLQIFVNKTQRKGRKLQKVLFKPD